MAYIHQRKISPHQRTLIVLTIMYSLLDTRTKQFLRTNFAPYKDPVRIPFPLAPGMKGLPSRIGLAP